MSNKAPSYKQPAFQAGIGNLVADVITYTFDGTETVGDPILLRTMSDRNTYVRATIFGSAGITAATAADLGYIDREGTASVVDALADGAVLTVLDQNLLAAPLAVGVKHDITLTPTVLTDAEDEVGETIIIVLEFVANS